MRIARNLRPRTQGFIPYLLQNSPKTSQHHNPGLPKAILPLQRLPSKAVALNSFFTHGLKAVQYILREAASFTMVCGAAFWQIGYSSHEAPI